MYSKALPLGPPPLPVLEREVRRPRRRGQRRAALRRAGLLVSGPPRHRQAGGRHLPPPRGRQ